MAIPVPVNFSRFDMKCYTFLNFGKNIGINSSAEKLTAGTIAAKWQSGRIAVLIVLQVSPRPVATIYASQYPLLHFQNAGVW